jgi:hypothetical protein
MAFSVSPFCSFNSWSPYFLGSKKANTAAKEFGNTKLATIKLGIGIAPRYCLVTNVSTEGVRIHVNGFEVIDEFVLLFRHSPSVKILTERQLSVV